MRALILGRTTHGVSNVLFCPIREGGGGVASIWSPEMNRLMVPSVRCHIVSSDRTVSGSQRAQRPANAFYLCIYASIMSQSHLEKSKLMLIPLTPCQKGERVKKVERLHCNNTPDLQSCCVYSSAVRRSKKFI